MKLFQVPSPAPCLPFICLHRCIIHSFLFLAINEHERPLPPATLQQILKIFRFSIHIPPGLIITSQWFVFSLGSYRHLLLYCTQLHLLSNFIRKDPTLYRVSSHIPGWQTDIISGGFGTLDLLLSIGYLAATNRMVFVKLRNIEYFCSTQRNVKMIWRADSGQEVDWDSKLDQRRASIEELR